MVNFVALQSNHRRFSQCRLLIMADESKNQSAIQAQAQIIPAGIPRRHVPRSKATYRARVVFLIVGVLIATASWICLGVAINEHAGKLPQSIIQPDTAYVVAVVPVSP